MARFDLKAGDCLCTPASRRRYNELHFTVAAPRYDLATRAMSLGRDAAWKRALVGALPALRAPVCVDLACGTGDLAFLLAERYPDGTISGLDITDRMLALARRKNRRGNVRFARADMCATGFPDGSVDVVVGSYALRNAPDLDAALSEVRRILKPGGAAAFLDFAKTSRRPLQLPEQRLLKCWCGLWGLLLHGNPEIHGYIAASLAHFPDRARFREMIAAKGFRLTLSRRYFLGITEMIVAQALPAGDRREAPLPP